MGMHFSPTDIGHYLFFHHFVVCTWERAVGNFTQDDKKEVNQSDLSASPTADLSLTVTSSPVLQRVADMSVTY